jgi:hypothetical protein
MLPSSTLFMVDSVPFSSPLSLSHFLIAFHSTLSFSLSLSHSLFLTLSFSLSLSHSLFLTLPITMSLSLTATHSFSATFFLFLSLTITSVSLSPPLSLSHFYSLSLSLSLLSLTVPISPSLFVTTAVSKVHTVWIQSWDLRELLVKRMAYPSSYEHFFFTLFPIFVKLKSDTFLSETISDTKYNYNNMRTPCCRIYLKLVNFYNTNRTIDLWPIQSDTCLFCTLSW